jgi:predicted outer membrane repeat protein
VRFEDCEATLQGGGAVVLGGAPSFRGCVFRGCRATDGGAIAVLGGISTLTRCLFVQNVSGSRGGALFAGGGTIEVQHCVLDRNSARAAGAAAVQAVGGFITATYSIVTNSPEGAALKAGGGGANGIVSFSCGALFGNRDPLDMTVGGLDTVRVVNSDPRFCQPLALNYSYDEASPLALPRSGCSEAYGIEGPPCVQVNTDAPPAAGTSPRVTRLHPVSPNPFNPATVIRFELAAAGRVQLALFDARGRRVTDLLDGGERQDAGEHQLTWRGLDRRGRAIASGVYFLQLSVDGEVVGGMQRLVLLR